VTGRKGVLGKPSLEPMERNPYKKISKTGKDRSRAVKRSDVGDDLPRGIIEK